jgi:hypothetical protein
MEDYNLTHVNKDSIHHFLRENPEYNSHMKRAMAQRYQWDEKSKVSIPPLSPHQLSLLLREWGGDLDFYLWSVLRNKNAQELRDLIGQEYVDFQRRLPNYLNALFHAKDRSHLQYQPLLDYKWGLQKCKKPKYKSHPACQEILRFHNSGLTSFVSP